MRLHVIGTGSKGNSYALVASSGEKLLIEAGVNIRKFKEQMRFDTDNISGCLVSHEHGDHADYVAAFSLFSRIYSKSKTILNFKAPGAMMHGRFYQLKEGKNKIGSYTVFTFDTIHDARHPVGFVICHSDCGIIVYATDTAFMPAMVGDIDHLIIEVNYIDSIIELNVENGLHPQLADRIRATHFSLEKAVKFIERLQTTPKSITAIHLSDHNANAKMIYDTLASKFGCVVNIAEAGCVYNLN